MLHISGKIHCVIIIHSTHAWNDNIFRCFFVFSKFWFSVSIGRQKGKKWPKMTKIYVCCTLYFRNHISYDLHLCYTRMCKRIVSPGNFFIFFYKILIFEINSGWMGGRGGAWGKRAKNSPTWQKILCLTQYFRNHTSYDCDFQYTCVKWWYLSQIFSSFKFLLLGVFRG